LTSSTDFERVRRFGESYAHPLIVLIALPNEMDKSRIATAAGRSIGKAVQRNKVKRMLRETIRPLIPNIIPGWDIIIMARKPIFNASYSEIQAALSMLLFRANLLEKSHDE
jgi:ribonuclease P protein component